MPNPGDAPGLRELVRRCADSLAEADGVTLSSDALETYLLPLAEQARERGDKGRDAAVARFVALYASAPVGIALADGDGAVVETNAALDEFLGTAPGGLRGTPIVSLGATQRDRDSLQDALHGLGQVDAPHQRERTRFEHANDGSRWADVTVATLPGDTPGSAYPVVLVEDANELQMLQETLRRQHVHDRLTGLANSAGFSSKLDTVQSLPAGARVGLVYLDIDGFKVINDGLGPGAADSVLQGVATKLASVFTEHDAFVARLSGDGFAVLLHGELGTTELIDLVEQAMAELAEPIYVGDDGVAVSISAGLVVRDAPVGDPAELLRAAEITLHRAKERGKAQWMLSEPDLDQQDRARFHRAAVLGGALENGEFAVEYQPTVKLDGSEDIAVVNAALRWNHPTHGALPAAELYPLADTTGMTLALGRLLLSAAVSETAAWRREFGDTAPDLCLRLPSRLAVDPNLVFMVRRELDEHELPANTVRLCADSTALLDPHAEVLESLGVLADLGVQLALAVTGAADLELVRAHQLPVGFLVVSGPLVDEIANGEPGASPAPKHLATLLERAHDLGLKRIGAEGVRDEKQAGTLRELGVVAGRGPLFGPAASEAEIETLIRQRVS